MEDKESFFCIFLWSSVINSVRYSLKWSVRVLIRAVASGKFPLEVLSEFQKAADISEQDNAPERVLNLVLLNLEWVLCAASKRG